MFMLVNVWALGIIFDFSLSVFTCFLIPTCFLLALQPNPGLPSTHHRRVACSFRDQNLYQVFQISLTSLQQLKSDGNVIVNSDLQREY